MTSPMPAGSAAAPIADAATWRLTVRVVPVNVPGTYPLRCREGEQGRIVAGEDGGARTGPRSGGVVAETRLADLKEGGKVRGRSWRLATTSILVGAGLGCCSLGAANGATTSGTGRAVVRATGDWGFSPLFMTITPSKARLTMNLRLECFSVAGCTADRGLALGPRDSYGRTIHFVGTSATSEPLVTSGGAVVGSCTMDPSPSGDISCHSSSNSIKVPIRGWVGTRDRITYTAFTLAKPGEPLASDSWSDSPTGVDPGNKTDNDSQLILTPPVPNPVWVFMNPTAVAFASGEAPQTEQVGFICSTESFCRVAPGMSLTAALSPSGVHYPLPERQKRILSGVDIDYLCRFTDTRGYKGPGTNLATCQVASATIIDHYGGAVLELPIEAASGAYPQRFDYRLTLSPARGATGEDVYTDLTIVSGLRITTAPRLPEAKVGHAYAVALHATGGVPTNDLTGPPVLHHDWALFEGNLPPGLMLSKGAISGTPTRGGSYGFRLVVSDGQGDQVVGSFGIVVA
ncbi:MAG: Ig domain-containing protein [Acidimicrobiales bacterium]